MYSINQNSRPGRKPLLDEAKRREICEILAVGGTRTLAACYVGCSLDTIARTAKRDRAFAKQLRKAEVECEIRCSRSLAAAAESQVLACRRLDAGAAYPGAATAAARAKRPHECVPRRVKAGTGRRQPQIRPGKIAKSSGKKGSSASPWPDLSLAACAASPQNSGRENGEIIEKTADFASAPALAASKPENAAPQNHPPIGEQTQNPSRKSPPPLEKAAKSNEKTFSARHRRIAATCGDTRARHDSFLARPGDPRILALPRVGSKLGCGDPPIFVAWPAKKRVTRGRQLAEFSRIQLLRGSTEPSVRRLLIGRPSAFCVAPCAQVALLIAVPR